MNLIFGKFKANKSLRQQEDYHWIYLIFLMIGYPESCKLLEEIRKFMSIKLNVVLGIPYYDNASMLNVLKITCGEMEME
jgi:hypothetical protein